MARFAELLGRDGERYARKAAQLRELINTKYYDAEKGLYANGSQAAQGVALYLGIVPEGDAQRVADNLARMIADNDYFLDFGTIGSKTVLRMLTRYGHVETAYKMAAQTQAPSWGWWVTQGFTTLAETWDALARVARCVGQPCLPGRCRCVVCQRPGGNQFRSGGPRVRAHHYRSPFRRGARLGRGFLRFGSRRDSLGMAAPRRLCDAESHHPGQHDGRHPDRRRDHRHGGRRCSRYLLRHPG